MEFGSGLLCLPSGGAKKDAKKLAIVVLGREWPLSAKQVCSRIRREGGREITYQGVYKALKHLVEQGVVKREGSGYSLDVGWIRQFKASGEELERAYSCARFVSLEDVPEGEAVTVSFPDWLSVPRWLVGELSKLPEDGGPYFVLRSRHVLAELLVADAYSSVFRQSPGRGGRFVLVAGDSGVDRLCAEFFRGFGISVKTGVKGVASSCDVLVRGKYVIQIFWPRALAQELGRAFSGGERGEVLRRVCRLLAGSREGTPVHVLVANNREVANWITEETLSHFGQVPKEGKQALFIQKKLADPLLVEGEFFEGGGDG